MLAKRHGSGLKWAAGCRNHRLSPKDGLMSGPGSRNWEREVAHPDSPPHKLPTKSSYSPGFSNVSRATLPALRTAFGAI